MSTRPLFLIGRRLRALERPGLGRPVLLLRPLLVTMNSADLNPISPFLEYQGVLVLDGGLATALEARGCDLRDNLWSAKVLLEDPDLIRQVHLDFLRGGADCIATASYQATLEGFQKRGLDREASRALLLLSLSLAVEARAIFWEDPANRVGRLRPLVAASIGPFGAFLADGSEYSGRYGISDQDLYDFHQERWQILGDGEADLMACETIPSLRETEVLVRLVAESPGTWAWISFSCGDGEHLWDGSLLREAARVCDAEARVAAVGINCTGPELIPSLMEEVRKGTSKPILAYPNSGESYDAEDKEWGSTPSPIALEEAAQQWVREGAAGVGGCCRVGPDTIRKMRQRVVQL